MISPDDLTLNDRQALADFSAFLAGGHACLICMTPTEECLRSEDAPCCPTCEHQSTHAALSERKPRGE